MGWVRRWGPWLELDPYLTPFLKRVRYPHPSSRAGQSNWVPWTNPCNFWPICKCLAQLQLHFKNYMNKSFFASQMSVTWVKRVKPDPTHFYAGQRNLPSGESNIGPVRVEIADWVKFGHPYSVNILNTVPLKERRQWVGSGRVMFTIKDKVYVPSPNRTLLSIRFEISTSWTFYISDQIWGLLWWIKVQEPGRFG